MLGIPVKPPLDGGGGGGGGQGPCQFGGRGGTAIPLPMDGGLNAGTLLDDAPMGGGLKGGMLLGDPAAGWGGGRPCSKPCAGRKPEDKDRETAMGSLAFGLELKAGRELSLDSDLDLDVLGELLYRLRFLGLLPELRLPPLLLDLPLRISPLS